MDYAIRVKNTGVSQIWVHPLLIYGKKSADEVKIGALPPGSSKSKSPYFETPNDHVVVSWTVESTGTKDHAAVSLEVPTDFWRGLDHREIIIELNPDAKKVAVLYSGYQINNDVYYYIDSNRNAINE